MLHQSIAPRSRAPISAKLMTDDLVLESFRDPCMFVSNSRVGLEAVTYQIGPINPICILVFLERSSKRTRMSSNQRASRSPTIRSHVFIRRWRLSMPTQSLCHLIVYQPRCGGLKRIILHAIASPTIKAFISGAPPHGALPVSKVMTWDVYSHLMFRTRYVLLLWRLNSMLLVT